MSSSVVKDNHLFTAPNTTTTKLLLINRKKEDETDC